MKPIRLPFFTYRFVLEGLNLERFINTMGKEGIPLLTLKRTGARKLVCECYQADMPVIEALALEKGWKLTHPQPLQLAAFLAFLRKRWGIPLGVFLMVALSVAMYQFVWRVEIKGAKEYQGDISAYLMAEGYHPGVPKTRVDAAALAQRLSHRYPTVAWFTVYVHDITLVVDTTLGVPPPSPRASAPADVVAAQDGIVDSILVYAGTAAVKAGDAVRKGQVLILGTERIADEGLTPVRAQGIVMARCYRSQTVSMPLSQVESESTGRSAEHLQLCTPWISYPAALETPSYLAFDTEISQTPLVGSFFPCWVKKTTFSEVALEYSQRNLEDVKKEAAAAAMQKLADGLRGNEIVDKWVDYCMIESGSLAATATAEWLMDIGSYALP